MSLLATGIVHGGALSLSFVKDTAHLLFDLNIGNFGFAFPQIADQDPSDVIASSKISGTTTWSLFYPSLSLTKPRRCLMSSPNVILQSIMTRWWLKIAEKDVSQTKIIDFGSGEPYFSGWYHILIISLKEHEAGTQPPSFQCQTRACAPELAFARTVQKIVNPPVDLQHSIFVLMTVLTVNIRFTKFLPMVNFSTGAACPTFLVRWLPWRAPCHQDGKIGMQT